MKVKLVLAYVLIVVLFAACASQSSDPPNIPSPSQTASPIEDDQIEMEPIFQEGTPTPIPTTDFRELEIVTLLPKDAIPAIDDPTFLSVDESDELYDPDELVIEAAHLGHTSAFPFSALSFGIVDYYELGPTINVVFNPETAGGALLDRRFANGQVLRLDFFERQAIVDHETGSTWDGLRGKSNSGPLEGETHFRVKSTQSFWFGWLDFRPDTEVFDIPGEKNLIRRG